MINAQVLGGYQRPLDARGDPLPQTYVFMKGHHLGGNIKDPTLERLPFSELVTMLSEGLARQKYLPTKDAAAADLAIVVDWGVTSANDDPDLLQRAIEIADVSTLAAMQSHEEHMLAANARLLGYPPPRRNRAWFNGGSSSIYTLEEAELSEGRYFVIVVALDLTAARATKKLHAVWAARLSLRARGTNFKQAAADISRIGGEAFGRSLGGPVRVPTDAKPGQVILHELKVIGAEEAMKPDKREKK